MRLGPLGKMIHVLLLQFFIIYHSSGQGAEGEIGYDTGIELCKLKCTERGGCLSIAYNIDKLACHLSHKSATDWKKKEGYICFSKQGNKIQAGACSNLKCKSNTRCVEKRGGGVVCVDDLPEKFQNRDKMSTQPGRSSKVLNITQQDLKDKWTTTEIRAHLTIKSLTWSPLFASDLYLVTEAYGSHYIMLCNSQLKSLTEDLLRLDSYRSTVKRLDTGRCLTNDSINCVYTFVTSTDGISLYSYREISNPRRLELERTEAITASASSFGWSGSIIACNEKFGFFLYLPQRIETKKYAIQTDEDEFTLKEMTKVQGLKDVQRIKWSPGGTFAVAMSATTLYFLNDKEQVIMKGKNIWQDSVPFLVANDFILVVRTTRGSKAYISVLRL